MARHSALLIRASTVDLDEPAKTLMTSSASADLVDSMTSGR